MLLTVLQEVQYLVKWDGYDESFNSWEGVEDLEDYPELIEQFHNQQIQSNQQHVAKKPKLFHHASLELRVDTLPSPTELLSPQKKQKL